MVGLRTGRFSCLAGGALDAEGERTLVCGPLLVPAELEDGGGVARWLQQAEIRPRPAPTITEIMHLRVFMSGFQRDVTEIEQPILRRHSVFEDLSLVKDQVHCPENAAENCVRRQTDCQADQGR